MHLVGALQMQGRPQNPGVAEQSHFRTKTAIEQALLLRGDRDFADEAAYLRFARAVVDETRNARAAPGLAEERPYLRPLPRARFPEYTTFRCVVSESSASTATTTSARTWTSAKGKTEETS